MYRRPTAPAVRPSVPGDAGTPPVPGARRSTTATVARLLVLAVIVCAAGCADSSNPPPAPEGSSVRQPGTDAGGTRMGPRGVPESAANAPADPKRNRERETATQVLAYPTGDPGTSVILLEKRFPAQARLGKPYVYELKVTNLKDYPIAGVVVREDFPASFTVQPPDAAGPAEAVPADGQPAAPADKPTAATQPAAAAPPPIAPASEDINPLTAARRHPAAADAVAPRSDAAPATRPAAAESSSPADPSSAVATAEGPAGDPAAATIPPATAPAAAPRPDGGPDVRYVQGTGYVRDIAGTWWATAARAERRGVIAREFLVGQLDPRQSKTIPVGGRSDELGKLDTRTTVTYTPVLAGGTDVINPILKLAKEAPRHADLCDVIEVRYVVSNVGVGTETDVRIDETLPDGLTTAAGDRSIRIAVGDLPQGTSKPYTVKVKAARTGEFTGRAAARGAGTAAESAEVATAVHAPKLTVALAGPANEYVGKPAPFELVVTNVGDAAARNATASAAADAGAAVTFPEAPGVNGGATSTTSAAFALGTLDPGQSRKVRVAARPIVGGSLTLTATAKSDCADAVSAAAKTAVLTIPSLVMEVSVRDDPVRVGEATVFRVTVRNVGSGADEDVKVSAVLPDQVAYAQSTGPTAGTADGKQVTFAALPRLDAGQSVTWAVEVKAAEAADVRFRAELTSKSLKEPVVGTQSAKLY